MIACIQILTSTKLLQIIEVIGMIRRKAKTQIKEEVVDHHMSLISEDSLNLIQDHLHQLQEVVRIQREINHLAKDQRAQKFLKTGIPMRMVSEKSWICISNIS